MDPCDEGRIHALVLQFGLQQPGLDSVEGAVKSKNMKQTVVLGLTREE